MNTNKITAKYVRSTWEVTALLNGVELTMAERFANVLNREVIYIHTLISFDTSNTLRGFPVVEAEEVGQRVEITKTADFYALYDKYQGEVLDYINS
jgi:hypothetical protein